MVLERERETNPSECIVHGSQLRRMLGRGPLAAQDIGSMVCPSFGGRDAKINPVCLEPAGAAVQNHPVRVSQSQLIPSTLKVLQRGGVHTSVVPSSLLPRCLHRWELR